jgi:diaminopimelate decarboxylase
VGTPVYVYSHATLSHHYRVFDNAFSGIPHIICYSMKANPNGSIIRTFSNLGSGVDIVSGGELSRAIAAGAPPSKIVYSGVGKMAWEIEEALRKRILMFNVESRQELETVDDIARRMRKKAPISLRVNPDVDPKTHPYISTGLKENKFGIHMDQAMRDYEWAARLLSRTPREKSGRWSTVCCARGSTYASSISGADSGSGMKTRSPRTRSNTRMPSWALSGICPSRSSSSRGGFSSGTPGFC